MILTWEGAECWFEGIGQNSGLLSRVQGDAFRGQPQGQEVDMGLALGSASPAESGSAFP